MNKGTAKPALILLLLSAVTACSAQEVRDGIYQGVFEGSRIEKGRDKSPAERAKYPDPDYNQYSRERSDRIEADVNR